MIMFVLRLLFHFSQFCFSPLFPDFIVYHLFIKLKPSILQSLYGELAQLVEHPDARGSGRSEVESKIMGN
jgi:hypothetical protein